MSVVLIDSSSPEGQTVKELAKRMAQATWNEGEALTPSIVMAGIALNLAMTAAVVKKDDPYAYVAQVAKLARMILDQREGMTKQ